jgi:hypothetical protein
MTLQTYEMVWRHAHHGYTILLPLIIASSSSLGGHAQLLGTLSRQQDLGEEVRRIINNDQYSIPPGQRPRSLARDDDEENYAFDNYYRNDEYEYFDPTLVDLYIPLVHRPLLRIHTFRIQAISAFLVYVPTLKI